MATITTLLEQSVIADLKTVSAIASLDPKPHDYDGALAGDDEPGDEEAKVTLSVTARDDGEFMAGSGIRKLHLELVLRANVLSDEVTSSLLDSYAEAIADRIPVQVHVVDAGPVQRLSTAKLKVFGIIDSETTQRTEEDAIRIRRIERVVIAAQLA